MKDDKSLLVTLVWLVITLALIGWTTYQSWHWFFDEKNPITNNIVISKEAMLLQPTMLYPEFKSFPYAVQQTEQVQKTDRVQLTLNPQVTAPAYYVQIDTMHLPFSGTVN